MFLKTGRNDKVQFAILTVMLVLVASIVYLMFYLLHVCLISTKRAVVKGWKALTSGAKNCRRARAGAVPVPAAAAAAAANEDSAGSEGDERERQEEEELLQLQQQ